MSQTSTAPCTEPWATDDSPGFDILEREGIAASRVPQIDKRALALSKDGGRIRGPNVHHVAGDASLERPDQSKRCPSAVELRLMRAALMWAVDLCPRIVNGGPAGNHAQYAAIRSWLSGCAVFADLFKAERAERVSFLVEHMETVGAIMRVNVAEKFSALGDVALIIDLGTLDTPPEKRAITKSSRLDRMLAVMMRA